MGRPMIVTLAWIAALGAPAAAQQAIARAPETEAERLRRIQAEIRRIEPLFSGREQPQEAAPPAGQDPAPRPAGAGEPLLLRDTTIDALIDRVSEKTQYRYRFLWEENDALRSVKIYYNVPERLFPTTDEGWFHLLHKILSQYGYLLEPLKQTTPGETVYRIRKTAGAAAVGTGAPAAGGGTPPSINSEPWDGPLPDREDFFPRFAFVHRYIKLTHLSTGEAISLLSQALGQGTQQNSLLSVMEIPGGRELRVAGYDYVVYEIEQIIKRADVRPEPFQFEIFQLRNALATQVEPVLIQLMAAIVARQPSPTGIGAPGTQPVRAGVPPPNQPVNTAFTSAATQPDEVKIVADPRTNAIIVQATDTYMKQVREMISKLDASAESGSIEVRVYRLKNTVAKDVTTVLTNTFNLSSGAITSGTTPGAQPGTSRQPTGSSRSGAGGGAFEELVPTTFVNDDASNSVIAVADRNRQRQIEKLIEKLDQRRPQINLQVVVVQITATDTYDLGVELAALQAPRDGIIKPGGRTNTGLSTIADVDGDGLPDIVPSDLAGGSFFLFKDRIGQLISNIHANKRVSNIKVLEKPELVVLDNASAKLTVQTNVPVLQSNVTGVGILTTSFLRFEPAETVLTISPHISEGNYVRLNIDVKVEKFTAAVTADATIPPPKTTRRVETEVNVPDRYTVVIGGLITNDQTESTQGVPFLYKIPVLGHLFRRDQEETVQTTLYVFVTPTILYDHGWGDLGDVTRDRVDDIESKKLKLDELTPWPPRDPRDYGSFRNSLPPGKR